MKVHDPKVVYDDKNWRDKWMVEKRNNWLWGGMVPLYMLIAIIAAIVVASCIG